MLIFAKGKEIFTNKQEKVFYFGIVYNFVGMEEPKYYTPDIEDFCPGFEYEQGIKIAGKISWSIQSFLITTWGDIDGLKSIINQKRARVKYLDIDDINDTGFSHNVTKKFQKPKLAICETTEKTNDSYYKIVYSFKNKGLELYSCEGLIFSGTIKNKSQLKKILTWTGVLSTKKMVNENNKTS